jgi:gluconokinase
MAQGHPLDDSDRTPWLDAVAAAAATGDIVVVCSALRRQYRQRLQAGIPDTVFVQLDVHTSRSNGACGSDPTSSCRSG